MPLVYQRKRRQCLSIPPSISYFPVSNNLTPVLGFSPVCYFQARMDLHLDLEEEEVEYLESIGLADSLGTTLTQVHIFLFVFVFVFVFLLELGFELVFET